MGTLKRPLKKAATRNLNLFEPRWLKMIDQVTRARPSPDDAVFGCVRCTNKFYSAIPVNDDEGRYADIIFEKVGTLAKIEKLQEGTRPVSGDRKLKVAIRGGDSFMVEESSVSVSEDGYLVAKDVSPILDNVETVPLSVGSSTKTVKMVVVVGLLHGNGVVDLLSKSSC